jgi:hypothetical protein
MGIAGDLMPILKRTPSTGIHWLTRTELKTTAMATDTIDGEQLLAGVAAPASQLPDATSAAIDALKARAAKPLVAQ